MYAEDGAVTRNDTLSKKKGDYKQPYEQFDMLRRRCLRQRGSLRLRSVAASDVIGCAAMACGSDVRCLRRTSPLRSHGVPRLRRHRLWRRRLRLLRGRKKEKKANRRREVAPKDFSEQIEKGFMTGSAMTKR